MTIVTKLTLESGDRPALDGVVDTLREVARRKGAELKGPHSDAPAEYHLPQYKHLDGDGYARYDPWRYTVYTRRLEVVGHDELAQYVMNYDFPASVHVEMELEQLKGTGRN